MNNRTVTYENYNIGDKVVLNERGKKYTKETYSSIDFDNVVHGIIISHDDRTCVVVDWYNHKGMKVLEYWYTSFTHMEYYETS